MLKKCGRARLLPRRYLYAFIVLISASTAFAQSQPPLIQPPVVGSPGAGQNLPANKENIIQKSGVMEEQAASQREKERVEEAIKEVEENVNKLVEEVNKPGEAPDGEEPKGITEKIIDTAKPMNPYDFRASEGQDPVTAILMQPVQVLSNHTADYEQIGPHLFPNVMIPDIVRLGTNAAGFDSGTCYARTVNLRNWCAAIIYMKIGFVKVPIGVRLTPSAEYFFPVSKAEAAQRPFVTRYIPHMQVGWMHKTITQTPQELNAFLQMSSSYQAVKNLSLMGSGGNLNLPQMPLAFGNETMQKLAKKADETVRAYPEKLRFVGQTSMGAGESVVVPELTSRMLKDVINEQVPNYTLGITITIFSAIDIAGLAQSIAGIASIYQQLKMTAKIQEIMKLIEQASYYKNMASPEGLINLNKNWDSLVENLKNSGKTVSDLNMTELGNALGANIGKIQESINGAMEDLGATATVGIVPVEMLCHNAKRPASLDEWNPYTDLLASFFLKGGGKLPIGFYELSRFPVLMQYRPELQQYAKSYSEFLQNPQQCSIFQFTPDMAGQGGAQLDIKPEYPSTPMCAIGMPLIDFSPKAPSPYDPQQSMKGVWNGFTLAAKYRPETFHQFDKDADKFSWISPDPNLPKECGPLFRPYQWSGSKNTEGHANIQLPTDQPNTAVQWRHMHCCVDPEASPFRGLGWLPIANFFASDWDEVKE